MRHLATVPASLAVLLAAACGAGPADFKEPPGLTVTSPARSLVRTSPGMVTVTGTVAPGATGAAVRQVLVNNVPATVAADGSFQADVQVKAGATLLHTVAIDEDGGEATDTRSVQAGELRAMNSQVDDGMSATISSEAFAAIARAAGNFMKSTDFGPLLAPANPMVDVGTVNGQPDCLYAQADVLDVNLANAKLALVPVQGGLDFTAEVDGLDVPAHARYAVACANGQSDLRVTATRVVVHGTLLVTPAGAAGFKTELVGEEVQVTGFHLDASGVPGSVVDMLHLDSAIGWIVARGATMFMEPMLNKALGALAGPKTVEVAGHRVTLEVTPSDISFDPSGGLVVLNTRMGIAGSETAPGYVFTDNGAAPSDVAPGFQLGLADDAANELLAGVTAVGMLNLSMPAAGGSFDATRMTATVPPMISADPSDGKMRVVVGDLMMDFMLGDKVEARAAVNVKLDLAVTPSNNGYGLALALGKPQIFVDVLPEVENQTHYTSRDLSNLVVAPVNEQIKSMSALLGQIPLPAVAGVQLRNVSISGKHGYVLVGGTLE